MAFANEQEYPTCFEDIFKQHYQSVVHRISWITKNQTVSEELAQEVFLQLYKTDWQSIENIKGWLLKSGIFVAYNYLRTERRQTAKVEKLSIYQPQQHFSTLDEDCIKKEERQHVQTALNKMNDMDKNILIMKFSGFQYTEIASALNLDVNCIGTKLARAKAKFSKLYPKRGAEL